MKLADNRWDIVPFSDLDAIDHTAIDDGESYALGNGWRATNIPLVGQIMLAHWLQINKPGWQGGATMLGLFENPDDAQPQQVYMPLKEGEISDTDPLDLSPTTLMLRIA